MQNLSGVHIGTFRAGSGNSAKRNYAVLSAFTVCSGETLRILDHEKLPRKLRNVLRQRNSVQSRIRTAGRNFCNAKNNTGGKQNRAGNAETALSGQSECNAGLGLRERLRGMHVANPSAGKSRRFCRGDGRTAFSARILPESVCVCRNRSGFPRRRRERKRFRQKIRRMSCGSGSEIFSSCRS